MEGIRISSRRRDGFAVVTVSGELDIVTSRRFDECLAEARRDDVHIIIDLSAVDFMDTGSLAVIVGHWKQVTAAGGRWPWPVRGTATPRRSGSPALPTACPCTTASTRRSPQERPVAAGRRPPANRDPDSASAA